MFERYLDLAIKAIFIENMALAFFLGMCSFIAVSRKVETAIGLGSAVIFVLTVTVPINNLVYSYLLKPGARRVVSDPAARDEACQIGEPSGTEKRAHEVRAVTIEMKKLHVAATGWRHNRSGRRAAASREPCERSQNGIPCEGHYDSGRPVAANAFRAKVVPAWVRKFDVSDSFRRDWVHQWPSAR